MKNHLGNLAPGTISQLAAAMRHQLDRIQRQPSLIAGFLGQTGLTPERNRHDSQTLTFQALQCAGFVNLRSKSAGQRINLVGSP
jgi:hypothetical protein